MPETTGLESRNWYGADVELDEEGGVITSSLDIPGAAKPVGNRTSFRVGESAVGIASNHWYMCKAAASVCSPDDKATWEARAEESWANMQHIRFSEDARITQERMEANADMSTEEVDATTERIKGSLNSADQWSGSLARLQTALAGKES